MSPSMAIATRRLQDSVAPPLVPDGRSAGGVRLARLDAAAPAGADGREAQRRLMEAAVDGADVAATVDAVARLTGSVAVLQDPFLAVLASAPPDRAGGVALARSGGPLVRELLRSGPGSDTAFSGDTPEPPAGPALVELPRSGSSPARLVAPVAARGELLGFLVVAAVDRVAYATLEAAAPVVALLLRAEDRLCRLLDRDQRVLFLDLLAGRSAASTPAMESLVIQGRRLGHDLEQPHWPLVFSARPAAGVRGCPPEVVDTANRLEPVVRDALRATRPAGGPAPVVGVDGDAVVVFLPGQHPDGPAEVAGQARAQAAKRGFPLLAGWGPRCDDPGAFGAGVERARWVVDVLAALPGEPAPAGYDDLGIYALLYEKRDRDQLAAFAERWLGPLRDHGELTQTLRVLLETGGPSAAATALYVHISTLKYRLRKIESILERDLSDPEVCFNLRLAFKIVAVHERLVGGRS